jgi:uncharacterized protein with HEPN domain
MKTSSSYLQHILDETRYLLGVSEGVDLSAFQKDETLKRAVVRSLEIIGEAVKNLPDDFKLAHPQIEWRKIAATRDRLIHGYFSVDFEIVWDVVVNKIPALDEEIKRLLG